MKTSCDNQTLAPLQCPATDPANPVYLDHPAHCAKYCICSGGAAYEENCLPGLVFDSVLHVCNWPAAVSVGRQCRGPELLRVDQISSDYRQSGK